MEIQTLKDERFEQWYTYHKKHPEAYEQFKHFTFELINMGHTNGSVTMVIERIRWEGLVNNINPKKEFKIGNNHKPFYARMFMAEHPEHDGFFIVRRQFSADKPPTGKEFTPMDIT